MKSIASTSDKILDIAQSLIVAGGYNGFSYADISDAIGIRKASIHHHFPAKAELVAVLVDRYTKQAQAGLQSLREQAASPADQLHFYIDYWRSCIENGSQPFCVCAMLASEMQMLPDEVASRVRAHFRNLAAWLTSVLQAGVEQGLFRLDKRPEEQAQMLMASVHGAMLSARALGDSGLFIAVVGPEIARLRASNC
ncbi:TetR/AcrR family transcriptional regulator [Rhizobium binae]|uniref:TetR/AcrR family transcriptional regulator n=1 Tax=Rhizobium binae TaxID=1138190 RepID=UPI001C8390C0|nr:TetR/AcrR family transcriptional regulator [Rhizobium binae]MBX4941781.1 TetR/AcrR family transcriptional regulator [Rhizobium binae]MBX4947796.1 TetR/AcrR family transcriptional regulator [Rhizobium binae]MBX4953663.1 TetR/AcrR family transcriptional regulator [Rhizobium binae]MBX4965688.1 TetR/AcrR family transcriptional regulator [Rhizobium binae]MBX4983689.1 TetR/AcrR family transcriptional regulator [Rhizobium binae]